MASWKLNIFANAVMTRMEQEGRTAEDILTEYPKLTEDEKAEIIAEIERRQAEKYALQVAPTEG